MNLVLKNAKVYTGGQFVDGDVYIENGIISDIVSGGSAISGFEVIDLNNKVVFPGFVDVHVHLREPGFLYKETIKTGTMAAARGGFTTVFTMPNLNPVPDCLENLKVQLDIIEKDAVINVIPYGSITVGEKQQELAKFEELAPYVCAFSDDGVGVKHSEDMREAMLRAKKLGKVIVAHCEFIELVNGGVIHDGEYARINGLPGNPSESEWGEVKRDAELCMETGAPFHVCHVSTKESLEYVRRAKAEGADITCETAPHYLAFTDMDLRDEGNFKMNPPIRSKEDHEALIAAVLDGTVDMIATDHAPHSAEEKAKGLRKSLNGVVGLETSFPEMYTRLVKTGIISLEKLLDLMCFNPAKRFGLDVGVEVGKKANLTVFDLDEEYTVDPEEFLTMGRATPFVGDKVFGRCKLTIANGEIAWRE